MKFKDYPFWRIDKFNLQIIKGGWHFSFLQTPQDIVKKIKSFSHGEFNTKNIIDQNKINEKILNNIDIFDRGYELKKINIDKTFPKYIVENQNILHDWIL